MNEKAFYQAYEQIIGKKASNMVESQVNRMRFEYSYQEIFNAIWYFYKYKGVAISSIEIYGIGLVRDARNMEEALGYFRQLAATRERAAASARKSKQQEKRIIKVKRQKQKVYREEYDWDE